MSTLLAVALFLVVEFCLVRAVGVIGSTHRRDLDVWHVLMGGVMLAMLVGPLPQPVALATLALAVVGLVWSSVRLLRRTTPGAYLRLALGWVAMVVMVLPVALAAPATAGAGGHQHAAGGHQHAASPGGWAAPGPLLVVLLAGLATVLLLRVAALLRSSTDAAGRWDACCDVVMAAAMGYMLLLLA